MRDTVFPVSIKLPSEYLVQGWTRNALARNKKGRRVSPKSRSAITWCISGAVQAVTPSKHLRDFQLRVLLNAVQANLYPIDIDLYNDGVCSSQEEAIMLVAEIEYKIGIRRIPVDLEQILKLKIRK